MTHFAPNGTGTNEDAPNLSGRNSMQDRLAMLASKPGYRKLKELMKTTIGAAAGQAALSQYARVKVEDDLGGARTIETVTAINRNSTASDVTELKAMLDLDSQPTYPANPGIVTHV